MPKRVETPQRGQDNPSPIPEAPQGESVIAGHRRLLLGRLLEQPLLPPEPIVPDLIYDVGLHWLYGPPGGGKTTIAMYCAEYVMLRGRPVIWFDFETDDQAAAGRLKDTVIPLQLAEQGKDIDDLFYYFEWPDRLESVLPDVVSSIAGGGLKPLVVFDSASKALSLTQWNAQVVRATKTLELPVIIIDDDGDPARGAATSGSVVWRIAAGSTVPTVSLVTDPYGVFGWGISSFDATSTPCLIPHI